jgi:protein SCO1/2|tara:strand:- start:3166 stop:3753 length:588 start_codon:yes stop_codon:yes gene_type:complete
MAKIFSYALATILLMGIGASWIIEKAQSSHDIPYLKPVPDFSMINQEGESFSQDNLQGKITILDFMFTSCMGPCPLMTMNMSKLHEVFSKEPEVQFVSITVDPDVDNQQKLNEYSRLVGGDDGRWHFLWSDIDSIKNLKKNGFMLFADNLPEGHAIKFVLIDHKGGIRKYYDGTDDSSQEILKRDVAQLVKSLRS